ncbi:MAG: sulfatase [Kiritimatiellales bacterium]|nr:sulfatase [Kiritimatiellales bacterium]
MKTYAYRFILASLAALLSAALVCRAETPNIVIIYADDLGWGTLSCYGQKAYQTPHLDRMAAHGVRLNSFYVATPSCAPSRVALLTGRFPYRTGVPSNPAPDAGRDHGIHADETTLAELLKQKNYATKIVGKWHLGHLPQYYPTRHGFDSYFGIPYSNDMRPVMLCRDEKVVEYPVVQNYLTQRYTAEAVQFIEQQKDRPFFLYLPHAMPHKPIAASEDFYTPETREDLYADVIRELDWSVGQVLGKLAELGLEEKTLVMFSSDNGPWYGGSTGGLRGMKGSGWEGGCRVPAIFQWKGRIPGGRVIGEPCATIDVFPTVCGLLGINPSPFKLDGHDIWPLLSKSGPGPEREIFVWNGTSLLAVRKGKWKFHWTAPRARPRGSQDETWIDERGPDGITIIAPFEQHQPWEYPSPADTPATAPSKPMQLFDLETDPGEQVDVTADHPEVVAQLKKIAHAAVKEAKTVEQPKLGKRPATIFYLGPGRLTEEDGVTIEEALQRTRVQ